VEALVARRVSERPVAGFNLVAVAEGEGICLHWDGTLRPVRFGPGAHVVSTDRDLDDPAMPEKHLFDRVVSGLREPPGEDALRAFLASHEGERPVCKHGDRFGTVSSTIYAAGRLLHAGGPPCRAPFADLSALLL
jgi:hypothetical protein